MKGEGDSRLTAHGMSPKQTEIDMKLLHTGDLHLDSAFYGTDVFRSDERRASQRQLFAEILQCAAEEQCDMVLIAGDLFDSRYVTPETAEFVRKKLEEANIPIVISPGNHDPFTEGSFYSKGNLPENVYIFSSSELQCFEFEDLNTVVFGYAFTSPFLRKSPLLKGEVPPMDGKIRLMCAHADLDNPVSRYAPITVGDIERFSVDYAALGHIHKQDDVSSSKSDRIRYCGFPEGRSYDELGEGSVLIVSIEDGKAPLIEKRVLSQSRYCVDEIDISDCAELGDICYAIKKAVAVYEKKRGTHLRLNLVGNVDPFMTIDEFGLANQCLSELAELELRDLTVPYEDGDFLKQDVTLRGAFYRVLYPQLISDDPEVRNTAVRALQLGLAAIEGRRIPEGGDRE